MMEKERRKPKILPNPLPQKPGIVEPIIAAGEMKCPGGKRPATEKIVSDYDGSYTGRPVAGDHPVQDVDDL